MNWKDIGIEIVLGLRDLLLTVLGASSTGRSSNDSPWLDGSNDWTDSSGFQDHPAADFDEHHND